MTPEEQAQQDSLKKMADGQDKAAVTLKRLMDAMEDLEDPVKRQARLLKDSERNFTSLDRAIKSGRTRWVDATQAIENLRETIEELDESEEKAAKKKQLAEVTDIAKRAQYNKLLIDGVGGLAKALVGAGVGVTKSLITSYQSGASAFQTYGDAMSAGIDQGTQTAKGFAAATGAGALALGALGVISGGTAVALGAIVGVAADVIASFNDLAKFGIQVAVKELEATSKAYNDASKAGAFFVDGIMEFRHAGPEAGLTMIQFSKLITENGEKFAQFGGSVINGVKGFRELGSNMKAAREDLIKLGYSVEEIASGALDYAAMVSSVSKTQRTDYANLAVESTKYLENLKVITAFTGEDAKRAKEAADRAATDAAVDARLRKEEAENNVNVRAKFEAMMMGIPPQLRESYKQAYGMYGSITGENAMLMTQSNTAMQDMNQTIAAVSDRNKDATAVTKEQLALQKQHAAQTRDEFAANQQSLGMAASANGQYRETAQALRDLNDYFNRINKGESPEKIRESLTHISKLGGDTGNYAKLIADSQDLHIRMQNELDAVIIQFQNFAKVTDSVIEGIQNALSKAGYFVPQSRPAPGTGSAPSTSVTGEVDQSNLGGGPQPVTPTPVPVPAPGTSGTSTTSGGKLQPYSPVAGLLSNGRIGGGGITPELQGLLTKMGVDFQGATLTSLNDADIFPDHKNSKHGQGMAVDFVPRGFEPLMANQYVDILKRNGFKFAQVERKGQRNANGTIATGDHVHAELAQGAIVDPSAGGTNVTVAEAGKRELITPLHNGRLPGMDDMIGRLDEMIRVLKDHKDISKDLLTATA